MAGVERHLGEHEHFAVVSPAKAVTLDLGFGLLLKGFLEMWICGSSDMSSLIYWYIKSPQSPITKTQKSTLSLLRMSICQRSSEIAKLRSSE